MLQNASEDIENTVPKFDYPVAGKNVYLTFRPLSSRGNAQLTPCLLNYGAKLVSRTLSVSNRYRSNLILFLVDRDLVAN